MLYASMPNRSIYQGKNSGDSKVPDKALSKKVTVSSAEEQRGIITFIKDVECGSSQVAWKVKMASMRNGLSLK